MTPLPGRRRLVAGDGRTTTGREGGTQAKGSGATKRIWHPPPQQPETCRPSWSGFASEFEYDQRQYTGVDP